ncbi:MAG TPA: hypothetical protein VN207_02615, partial [Ktedonobacteraceae bacterium]|nr:hypothetical protein [Ktedonobacteraceae bacterium]
MKSTITLFDADTIDQLPWPNTEDGIYARSYLLPFIKCGPTHFIDNIKSQCMVILIDKQVVLPISVNVQEYDNSYVCSPYSHYVTYAKEELVLIQQQWLRVALSVLIDSFGLFCKLCGINRVVHVNNWLLSTNLYPDLRAEYVTAMIDFLKERFPKHTIIFRSLNNYSNTSLLDALKNGGCKFIPSRQVYLVHPNLASLSKKSRWQLKHDFALLKQYGYTIGDAQTITNEDIPRIVELYNMLYLQKYSFCNPMFNKDFIKLALEQQTLHLVAIRKSGQINAILGYFCRNGIMTPPLFGYDT